MFARRRYSRLVSSALFALLWLVVGPLGPAPSAHAQQVTSGALTVFFLNAGQGDAVLLVAPDGTTAMIDAGDTSVGPELVRFLGDRGITSIDWWLPSHPHADHVGGFTRVLEAGIPVRRALLSPQQYTTATWLRQLGLLLTRVPDVRTAEAGMTFALDAAGQVQVTVLNPPSMLSRPTDVEDNSVVLLITHGATRWLFTGDITAQGETEIVARQLAAGQPLPKLDVLKVTHHGSASGSSAPFLALTRPARAVIGVGANGFGHPTQAALDRLAAVGAEVFRTDRHGTVVATSDGTTVGVELAPHLALIPTGLALPPSEPAEAAAENAPAPTPGSVVALVGTPHLWIADEQGALHWGGDTRGLAGRAIDWGTRTTVTCDQLRGYRRGDPWLSAGLLKEGDPIYQVKWETGEAAPRLLHILSIADVELFGIGTSNYGTFVVDSAAWRSRWEFDPTGLSRAPLAPACASASVTVPTTATVIPPATSTFDPSRYLGQGDAYDCGAFTSQADAQAVLRAEPSDPNRLDTDRDGIACESNRAPIDRQPVAR